MSIFCYFFGHNFNKYLPGDSGNPFDMYPYDGEWVTADCCQRLFCRQKFGPEFERAD